MAPEIEDVETTPPAVAPPPPAHAPVAPPPAPSGETPVAPPRYDGAVGESLMPPMADEVEELETRPYWLGLHAWCPKGVVHIAGVTFQKFVTPPVEIAPGAPPMLSVYNGLVVRMTKSEVEAVRAGIRRKWFTMTGVGRGRATTMPTGAEIAEAKESGKRLRVPARGPKDLTYAECVYMVPQEHRGASLPPSVYETGIDWE